MSALRSQACSAVEKHLRLYLLDPAEVAGRDLDKLQYILLFPRFAIWAAEKKD
jgi:hypothetical protein